MEKKNHISKGQVHIVNIARCGNCRKEHRFPFWSSRIMVDITLRKDLQWVDTNEYGLLCPNCLFKLFENVTYMGQDDNIARIHL